MHVIELSQRADIFLNKLDRHIRDRIVRRLKNLKENPVPSDAKFIERENNSMVFRYRIGNFRVLYKNFEKEKIILITKIDKRPRVYQK